MRPGRLVLPAFVIVLLGAAPARADSLFTPFIGANMGGSADAPLADLVGSPSRTSFGASFAVMGGGVLGLEADIGYTPKFFGTDLRVAGVPISLVRNNVLTGMINLTAGVPIQGGSGVGIRPYGVAGVGLIRQQLEAVGGLVDTNVTDFGYDIGGGAMIFMGRHVGIRGDLRYFRTTGTNPLTDLIDLNPGAFNFTRASVGVTLRY
jgi:hypothetical protein